jgi:AraC-like DNA-binding protein/quercetin dioxygenase-like cupin family protein
MLLNTNKSIHATPSISMAKEISKDGKHIIEFDNNFPITSFLFSFKYDFILAPNYHDYLEIGYIVEGKGFLNIENKKCAVKKDDIIVIGNHELHTWTKLKNEGFTILVILFLPELIFKAGGVEIDFEYLKPFFLRSKNFSNIIHSTKINYNNIQNSMDKTYYLLQKKSNNYKLAVKTYLVNVLWKICSYYENDNLKPNITYSKKIEDISRLKEIIIFIQTEYQNSITLEELAKKANLSKYHFCKFFKKVMGCTFTKYLAMIRIDKAKELLLTENLTATTIAYRVGFDNLGYFFKKFKELTGLSPREFKYKIKSNKKVGL